MRNGLIIADLEEPSVVYGVHGTTGDSQWKCLARRTGLHGAWEAVEWAWLPPGGISGEHLHTRTEEVYFILSGKGEMRLNGHDYEVEPGHLILTGLWTQHGLRNIGQDGLGWLVIELLSAATDTVLNRSARNRRPHALRAERLTERVSDGNHKPRESLMNAEIFNLRETPEVDPRSVFTGPLRKIQLVNLQPGQRTKLSSTGVEHTLFILGGAGEAASSNEASVSLKYGVSITLPLDTGLSIIAGQEGLEYFLATLEVPAGPAA